MPSAREKAATKTGSAIAGDVRVDSLPHALGFSLRRLQLAYKRHFSQLTAGTDFHLNHLGILSLIARNPGVAPTALAAALTTDAAQITTVLNLLEIRGWISRQKSPTDSRSRSLCLTASGKLHHKRLAILAAEAERSFVGDALSAGECQHLLELLDRLQRASNNRC